MPGIVDDAEMEGDEVFIVRLVSLRDAAGLPLIEDGERIVSLGLAEASADYRIIANDGFVAPVEAGARLGATARLVLREGRSGVITITRPEGVRGRIRGFARGVDGDANPLTDYTIDPEFTLAPAQYSVDVRITARADSLTEMQEEEFAVEIVVAEPGSGVLPPAVMPTVFILDNDRNVKIRLTQSEVRGFEGDVLEVKLVLEKDGKPAPPRSRPVYFTLLPGNVDPSDYLVTVLQRGELIARRAFSGAEINVTGFFPPDKSEASVSFVTSVHAIDPGEGEQSAKFFMNIHAYRDVNNERASAEDILRNSHDNAIQGGGGTDDSLTLTIMDTPLSAATNVLIVTPTNTTRVYGEAAPAEFAYTIAPRPGSTFAAGDTADSAFFTANPLRLITPPPPANPNAAGAYAFALVDSPAYASGVAAKYEFMAAPGVRYTITRKEITFTGAGVDKAYDGSVFVPQVVFTPAMGRSNNAPNSNLLRVSDFTLPGRFRVGDIEEFHAAATAFMHRSLDRPDETIRQTHDDVHVRGGFYAGKDAGGGQEIRGFGLAGRESANYVLSAASSAHGAITPRPVRITFRMLPVSPPDARAGRFIARVDRARTRADGVLADELAGFHAGLRATTAFATRPQHLGYYHHVAINVLGSGCGGVCGMNDSGNFKAANYMLADGISNYHALALVGDFPQKPDGLAATRSRDGARAMLSWNEVANRNDPNPNRPQPAQPFQEPRNLEALDPILPIQSGAQGHAIETYYVRWRSAGVAADADATPPIAAMPPGRWQNAAGDADLGENVGAAVEYAIRGLIPGRVYEAQVRAENLFGADGRGDFSDSAFLFAAPPPPPPPPVFTALTAQHGAVSGMAQVDPRAPANVQVATGERGVTVTWEPPSSGTPLRYEVRIRPEGGGWVRWDTLRPVHHSVKSVQFGFLQPFNIPLGAPVPVLDGAAAADARSLEITGFIDGSRYEVEVYCIFDVVFIESDGHTFQNQSDRFIAIDALGGGLFVTAPTLRAAFRAPPAIGGRETTPLVRWRKPNGIWLPAGGHLAIARGANEVTIRPVTAGARYEVQLASRSDFRYEAQAAARSVIGAWSASKFITPQVASQVAPASSPLVFRSLGQRFGVVSGQAPAHPRQLPANVQLAPGDASIRVTWDAPPGRITDPPLAYAMRIRSGSGNWVRWDNKAENLVSGVYVGRSVPGGASVRSAVITGLTNGTSYEVGLYNLYGANIATATALTAYLGGGIFATPRAPTLLAALRDAKDADGYRVDSAARWRAPGGGAWQPTIEITRNASEVAITVPSTGVRYEVQLSSRDGSTISGWGASKFATLQEFAPPLPAPQPAAPGGMSGRVFANAYGGANIEVTWNPPADGSARIHEYEVQWRLDSATTFAAADSVTVANDGRNAHVIRALAAGEYKAQVRARNRIGAGAFGFAAHGGNEVITTGGGADPSLGIAPVIVSLVPGDARLTLNWALPQYADGTVIDYGVTYDAYRARWSRRVLGEMEYANPAGLAGERVAITDSPAARAHDISGLVNGVEYLVEMWLETSRDQAELDAYLGGSANAARRRDASQPLAPIVKLLGTPGLPAAMPADERAAPALNALQLGAQTQDNVDEAGAGRFVTIDASWAAPSAAPGGEVRTYQLRWRPFAQRKNWQTVDLAADQRAYTIREYVRDDPGMPGLREVEYEAQILARFADDEDSAWSASRRITPPDPRLRGMLVTAAHMQDGAPVFRAIAAPFFAPGVFTYAFKIPHAAIAVHLTPQAAAGRTITLSINGGDAQPLAPNARSRSIAPGAVGARTIVEVRVSATTDAASSSATYAYTLTRQTAPPAQTQPPGAPSNVNIISGAEVFLLSWDAPEVSGGDPNYIDYRVRWRVAGGVWQPGEYGNHAGLAQEYTIGGLAMGTTYETQVRAVSGRGGVGLWSEPIAGSPVAFTLDVNASGGAGDGADGIYISRYLLGLRGDALIGGYDLPTGVTLEQVIENIQRGKIDQSFDVDNSGAANAADGIMIARYLLGVTGPALTDGQSNTDAGDVEAAIEALQP
ncbi:MAG: fibronectin type III domain-containing protein [Gammaproteobacteria bacterium]